MRGFQSCADTSLVYHINDRIRDELFSSMRKIPSLYGLVVLYSRVHDHRWVALCIEDKGREILSLDNISKAGH